MIFLGNNKRVVGIFILALVSVMSVSCRVGGSAKRKTDSETVAGSSTRYFGLPFIFQIGSATEGSNASVLDTGSNDRCSRVVVDSSGYSYCTGPTYGGLAEAAGGNADIMVAKFDPSGNLVWIKQIGSDTQAASAHVNSTTGLDLPLSIDLDSSGNILVGGVTNGALGETAGGGLDMFVLKMDTDGDLVWLRHVGDVTEGAYAVVNDTAGSDACSDIVVDSTDSVYCAGYSAGALGEANGGGNDVVVVKFSSAGVPQWVSQLGSVTQGAEAEVVNTGAGERCNGVAVDSSDNIYCFGLTSGSLGETTGGGQDLIVVKMNSAGGLLWVTQIGNTTEGASILVNDASADDTCLSGAVNSQDEPICVGHTEGALAETYGGGSGDLAAMKLDASGNLVWLSQVGSDTQTAENIVNNTSGTEECNDVAIDYADNVVCGGYSDGALFEANGGLDDVVMASFSDAGALNWVRQFGSESQTTYSGVSDTSGADECAGIDVDIYGYAYCVGNTVSIGEANGGGQDIFLLRVNRSGELE